MAGSAHRRRPAAPARPGWRTRTSSRGPPRTRPRSGRRGPRRRGARSRGRGPSRRPGPAPGRPCRSARRSASGRPSRCRCRGRSTATTTSPPSAAHRDPDLAAVGAELDRVVDEVDEDLAEARLVAADRRQARLRRRRRSVTAVALGEQPQALDGALGEPAEVDVVRERELAAALDPGEVEQLADHLDEVARSRPRSWRSAPASAPARRSRLRLARERLREQADGATAASAARGSGCR